MAKKQSDQPEQTPDEKELEQRIEAIMQAGAAKKDQTPIDDDSSTEKIAVKIHPTAPVIADAVDEEEEPAEAEPELEAPIEAATESEAEPVLDDKLADTETDKAVDDIVAKEGDTVLAVADAKVAKQKKAQAGGGRNWKTKLKAFFKNKWTLAAIALLLLVIFAVPATRYKVLGLALKKSVALTVIDSKTSTPVSNAQIELGGATLKTDGDGIARTRVGVGSHQLSIQKRYYSTYKQAYFVGFKTAPTVKIQLTATGRLVPVTVTNKITGKPLAGATIQVLGTTARTDAKGLATVALPTLKPSQAAKLSFGGYNNADVTVQVTDQVVKANSFTLTPTGHVYFLSNLSGSLDVVKTNLDGSGRKTVLEGTGHEEATDTSLLASRDWRYLVLKSRRDGDKASLYLIDTATDKATQFDNGNASFSLVGWAGHNFVYQVSRDSQPVTQANRQALKSYDADHQQLNLLDQNQAEGSAGNFAYQQFGDFYIVNDQVVYVTQWITSGTYSLDDKSATIRGVQANGQNKKDYQSFPAATIYFNSAALYEPNGLYFAVYDRNSQQTNYYEFEDQAVKTASVDQSALDQGYPTFLLSPSGNQTFWTELRDGKNTLFIGDANAQKKKQIASLSDYSPYGWYSDTYTLVSKNSSQLYIMPASGLSPGQTPLKLSDYYKPSINYRGYGGGYGGL